MPSSTRDVALAEEGLRDLEVMLEKPKSDGNKPTLAQATAACSDFFRPNDTRTRPQQLQRTAYLDGLRGFAALLVFILHHSVWAHSDIKGQSILGNSFGWGGEYYLVATPGLRILFSGGHLSVAIFFVVSGYVLSAKPLSLIHLGETVKLADNLGSSLFRRWLRLYIPVIGTTFVWMTSWHLFNIRSSNKIAPIPESTYFGEIWKWYCDFKNYSFVFGGDPWNAYNDHTWSIPLEFRGSIIVYTCLLAFSRCSRNARLWCEAGLIFYFHSVVDGWYCGLFVMGMLLCDLDLLAKRNHLPQILYRLKPLRGWIFYVLFAVALYLGGVPSNANDLEYLEKSPGWYYLSWKPQAFWSLQWFFRFWAATFVVVSIPRISWLKAFFEARFCQHLGRISFGFYLIHGPVLWSLGDRLYAASGRIRPEHIGVVPGWINLLPLPGYGPFGLELNFLVPQLILLAVTLWLAELATKIFDEPSLRFSHWLYKKTIASDEPSEKPLR